MRSDMGPYAVIPRRLLGRVTPSAVAVFAALASFADEEDGAFPSVNTLADILGSSASTVRRGWANSRRQAPSSATPVRRRPADLERLPAPLPPR